MTDTDVEPTVSLIHIPTWENDLEVYEITDPIPVVDCLDVITRPGRELEVLPYVSLIAGGRYDGGHVLMLHAQDNTYMYAVPPEVILLLKDLLADEQYCQLIQHTPSLAGIAMREQR